MMSQYERFMGYVSLGEWNGERAAVRDGWSTYGVYCCLEEFRRVCESLALEGLDIEELL